MSIHLQDASSTDNSIMTAQLIVSFLTLPNLTQPTPPKHVLLPNPAEHFLHLPNPAGHDSPP